MEPEGSPPHLQEPATCPYPEPDWSSPCPPSNLSKIHFNIILPSTPGHMKLNKEFSANSASHKLPWHGVRHKGNYMNVSVTINYFE
jgi:hypothetical protein